MNRLIIAAAVLVLSIASFQSAKASDRGLNGLIIGGGSGAIIGQAIGRNTESTIIGATVGSVIGLIVGSEIDRRPVSVNTYRYAPQHLPPAAPGWNRFYPPPQKRCEPIVVVRNNHHFDRRVVRTVCWDGPGFGHQDFRPGRHSRFNR